jgi:non-specific serine/threonine protein kinase
VAPSARASVREPAGNLPVDVTSFVGRRREITLTKRLLAESRLVTLTGPGGVGKTRLALRVANNMRRSFRDKAWFVALEELRDPTVLVEAVSEQLNLGGSSSGDDLSNLVDHLRNREMLLVLDNCEHLVDDVALFVDTVLRSCPGVRFLATSRQSLGVAGESTMVVPPLQTPNLEHMPPPEAYEQYASVRLFADRARAILPEFTVDTENGPALLRLCHHLDGNPLAIELAAVRLRSLSLQQLEERLSERYELLTEGRRGAPARQQTLRALIDWSYDLCTAREQVTWARISVFSGSFELDAAEHVAGYGFNATSVLGAVHALVDKSVLLREEESGEVRYRLLQALREYGQDRLSEFGEQEDVQRRHREWYAEVIDDFTRHWLGPDQASWVERLRKDQGNLRVALHSAITDPDNGTTALRMATGLGEYWGIRGLNSEAQHWLHEALAVSPEPTRERSRALRAYAWFSLLLGDPATAAPLLDEASTLAARLNDEVEKAYAAQTRAMGAVFRGDLKDATRLLGTTLETFRDRGVLRGELFGLFSLGLVRGLVGEYELGLAMLEQCVERTARIGEDFWQGYALWATAHIEFARGSLDRAESAAKDALRLQRRLRNRFATAFVFDTLAWIAEADKRPERAARLFGAAAAAWDAVRAAPGYYEPLKTGHVRHERLTREALGDHAFSEAYDRGYRLAFGGAVDYALEVKKSSRGSSARDTRQPAHSTPLTRREREIADLVAQGRTNKEIAETLVIAQRTVEGHVQHILTKLDFTSRAQVAGWIAGQQTGETAS